MSDRVIPIQVSGEVDRQEIVSQESALPVGQSLVKMLLLAAWFGLATGLTEVSIRAAQKFFLGSFVPLSPFVVWMAPLADVILFIISGLVIFLIAKIWPRMGSLRVVAFVFAFLGLAGPLFAFPRIGVYGALLLLIGLAVQASRLVAAHATGFQRLVRGTTGWMIVLVIGLGIGVYGWLEITERRALSNLPPPPSDAPNVLLITLDTVRAESLSLYGYSRPTSPQLERFAKTGVVFERALSTSPWTLPSHASLFTGRYPHELSADWKKALDDTYPTLAENFNAHGYLTAGFAANLLYGTYEHGLDRGFTHYEDYPVTVHMVAKSSWLSRTAVQWIREMFGNPQHLVRKKAEELNRDFLSWLPNKAERPFFVFLNYFDAHTPYLPPAPFATKFGPERPRPDLSMSNPDMPPQDLQTELDAYDSSLAYLDHNLGLLFEELQKRGVLENTLVIITSDHGEHFGEHGLLGHGTSLYRPLLHVPLIISFPSRIPAGKSVRDVVTLRDVPATIVELVNLDGRAPFPGRSLAHSWDEDRVPDGPASPLLSEVYKGINTAPWDRVTRGDMRSLVFEQMNYIRNGDGVEELYNFDTDVEEKTNLAELPEYRQELERRRRLIETIRVPVQASNR